MFERPEFTEVGCWIGESRRGVGYTTEAAQALIDRAFADTTVTMLWCVHRVMNAEARRVIEKCGFQFRETGMARSPNTRGAIPVDRFALDRRNWVALHRWGGRPRRKHDDGETRDTAA
jgi:RimJ/RimL family protein N-acetyltransferase